MRRASFWLSPRTAKCRFVCYQAASNLDSRWSYSFAEGQQLTGWSQLVEQQPPRNRIAKLWNRLSWAWEYRPKYREAVLNCFEQTSESPDPMNLPGILHDGQRIKLLAPSRPKCVADSEPDGVAPALGVTLCIELLSVDKIGVLDEIGVALDEAYCVRWPLFLLHFWQLWRQSLPCRLSLTSFLQKEELWKAN